MQVARRAGDGDLGIGEAAQEGGDGWGVRVPLAGIADETKIGLELITVLLEKRRQARAAGFFLALEQHRDIDRQPPMHGEKGAAGLDEGHDLAFVVGGAAGDDDLVTVVILGEAGGEGRHGPRLERVRRLHVVMTVEQHAPGRSLWRSPMGDHHRLAGCRLDARLEADLGEGAARTTLRRRGRLGYRQGRWRCSARRETGTGARALGLDPRRGGRAPATAKRAAVRSPLNSNAGPVKSGPANSIPSATPDGPVHSHDECRDLRPIAADVRLWGRIIR